MKNNFRLPESTSRAGVGTSRAGNPSLRADRQSLAAKPLTTVLPRAKRRVLHKAVRGNFFIRRMNLNLSGSLKTHSVIARFEQSSNRGNLQTTENGLLTFR
ncbi:MAG: hypothetical protein IKH45_08040 [Neisseriaceae bacterium]|nr:hypothetical protein [Neisseriaceae bacterium]